jgi:hypothetical protein
MSMKKKIVVLFVMLVAFCWKASAQFEKGNLALNAGVSFGLIGYGYGYYGSGSGFLPVTISGEYSINDNFAVGAYFGYFSRSYNSGEFRFKAMSYGARGTFHASSFLNEKLSMNIPEKLDIYASVLLGVESLSWKYKDETISGYYTDGSRVILGPVLGARYLFSPNFGAFFEFGRGAYGLGTLGITGKF